MSPRLHCSLALPLALIPLALAAEFVVVEDWSASSLGTRGIPPGWQRQSWGQPAYDFTVVEDEGRRALHMKSQNENSTITKDIRGRVHLRDTPILEWSWKAVTLPKSGDARRGERDDQAAQVYVTWPRFPEALRSRIIGYIWDTTTPVGTIVKSEKTGTVTYVVVRSGSAELGQWLSEQRNVWEDFEKIYGEEPDNPGAISIAINTNNTRSVAESFVGTILFRPREERRSSVHVGPRRKNLRDVWPRAGYSSSDLASNLVRPVGQQREAPRVNCPFNEAPPSAPDHALPVEGVK